jgi:predicted aminopeptidase
MTLPAPRPRRAPARMTALMLAAALGSGCTSTGTGTGPGYYWQSVSGHLHLMNAARPVQDWIADPATPPALRQKLELARRMRAFAVTELALPDNASYHRYADLRRRAAVYNVVAAPALSLKLHNWCFPVVGCVGYRGYFDESAARAFAATLPDTLEVVVYPVPAYSTLGWMNWAGGDPLLNTFIGFPEGELARMVFHELAHQVLYVRDDTAFNESFATAVERLGGARWLAQEADDSARAEYAAFDARRRAFRALTASVRERLKTVYEDEALDDAGKHVRKAEVMAAFREEYQTLRASWGGFAGYDPWVARANNASFAAQAAYDEWVPAFEALFEREGRDFARFYDAVRALARLDRARRHAELRALTPPTSLRP